MSNIWRWERKNITYRKALQDKENPKPLCRCHTTGLRLWKMSWVVFHHQQQVCHVLPVGRILQFLAYHSCLRNPFLRARLHNTDPYYSTNETHALSFFFYNDIEKRAKTYYHKWIVLYEWIGCHLGKLKAF